MPDCRSANSMIVANSIVVPKPAKNGSAIRQPWSLLVHGLGLATEMRMMAICASCWCAWEENELPSAYHHYTVRGGPT